MPDLVEGESEGQDWLLEIESEPGGGEQLASVVDSCSVISTSSQLIRMRLMFNLCYRNRGHKGPNTFFLPWTPGQDSGFSTYFVILVSHQVNESTYNLQYFLVN